MLRERRSRRLWRSTAPSLSLEREKDQDTGCVMSSEAAFRESQGNEKAHQTRGWEALSLSQQHLLCCANTGVCSHDRLQVVKEERTSQVSRSKPQLRPKEDDQEQENPQCKDARIQLHSPIPSLSLAHPSKHSHSFARCIHP